MLSKLLLIKMMFDDTLRKFLTFSIRDHQRIQSRQMAAKLSDSRDQQIIFHSSLNGGFKVTSIVPMKHIINRFGLYFKLIWIEGNDLPLPPQLLVLRWPVRMSFSRQWLTCYQTYQPG